MIKASQILEALEQIRLDEERIVLNPQDADRFVDQYSHDEEDPEIRKWLERRLRLFLINDFHDALQVTAGMLHNFTNDPPQYVIDALDRGQPVFYIRHIATGSRNHRMAGVSLEDDIELILRYFRSDQKPRNLLAVTYRDALKLASQWEKINKKRRRDESDPYGVKEVANFGSIRWVQVWSDEALDREGEEMHNCISAKEYEGSDLWIYSLRDSRNKPHVSVAVSGRTGDDTLSQIKGYNNGNVEPEYHEACRKFLNDVLKIRNVSTYCIKERDLAKIGSSWDPDALKVVEDLGIPPFDEILERVRKGATSTSEAAEWIKILIKNGQDIDVNSKDDDYMSLLTHAIEDKDDDGVTELLKLGADPDFMYDKKDERTLVFLALKVGKTNPSGSTSFLSLFAHKADINWQDVEGLTPLMYALTIYEDTSGAAFNALRILIEDSDLTLLDEMDRSALHYACMNPKSVGAYLRTLVKGSHRVINQEDRRGEVPLTIAAAHGSLVTVKVLLEEGADRKYVPAALEVARKEDHTDVANYLEAITTFPKLALHPVG
jgi:hypothetical protein